VAASGCVNLLKSHQVTFAIVMVTRTQAAMAISAFSQGQTGRTLYDMSVELKPVTGRTMRK